jgi:hypothetical protein
MLGNIYSNSNINTALHAVLKLGLQLQMKLGFVGFKAQDFFDETSCKRGAGIGSFGQAGLNTRQPIIFMLALDCRIF